MNSMQRVLTTLSFKEPDRVPLFLLLTTHGARELGMSIKDYFADPEAVAEGQWRMRQRYGHDCLYAFTYAALETEAWGGKVDFREDGPPNASSLLVAHLQEIDHLKAPSIKGSPCLIRSLKAIRLMKSRAKVEVPIIGVVMSPFSVPVMQLGFAAYLDLIHDDKKRFWKLMEYNQDFCVRWANAQLEAGAAAICYFDPVSSTDMIPLELYRETGFVVAKKTIAGIKGPTATHLASGKTLRLVELLAETKTDIVGISTFDDLTALRSASYGKLSLLGNLNSISMRHWTKATAEKEVKNALRLGAPGGGFILSDNHGEIHYSVPESVLESIAEAARTWGRYPLDWLK